MNVKPVEYLIGELLTRRNLHLAVAESCTGGLIGDRITNVPGASDYFLGGAITYSDQVKRQLLGVNSQTLDMHGAVSREVALEMAQGVRDLLNAEIGLAVTGIAGPTGGTAEKPVGLTWIGLSTVQANQAYRYVWSGDRLRNKEQSAEQALELLLDYLQGQQ